MKAASGRKVERLKIEGIGVLDDARRYYPEGEKAAQVVGSVGVDNVGLSGLEQQLDEELRGADGEQRIVKDARGDPVSLDELKDGHSGKDLRLTLDVSLQDRAEQVLGGVGRTYQPKGATAIVMDPRNGDLLAMANWPRVDANRVEEAPAWARVNRAVGFTYEPGSTFKSFTVAGRARLGGSCAPRPPSESVRRSRSRTARSRRRTARAGSSPCRTSWRARRTSAPCGSGSGSASGRFDRWVHRFGFGQLTDLPLPGESAGIVPRAKDYSGSSIGNLPIGQGLAVTPMQMVAAYAAIANGGVLVKPRLVLDGEPRGGPAHDLRRTTAARVRRMLEGVLGPTGTAPEAAVAGYDIAGKTGTAEKPEDGGYSKDKVVASFVGFAPAAEPAAAGRRDRGRAQGRALGRRGCRAGVREDRQLRAALPRHPAGVGTDRSRWRRGLSAARRGRA